VVNDYVYNLAISPSGTLAVFEKESLVLMDPMTMKIIIKLQIKGNFCKMTDNHIFIKDKDKEWSIVSLKETKFVRTT
jgi:hypothetical protein